jgi:hypothetical protein
MKFCINFVKIPYLIDYLFQVITNNSLDHEHFGNSYNAGNVPKQQQIPFSANQSPVHNLKNYSQGMVCNQANLVEAGVDANSNPAPYNERGYVMGYWTPEEDRLVLV